MKEGFSVGVAGEVISPELGTPLYGYAFHRPASAVADDRIIQENLKLLKKFNHYTIQKKPRYTHG